MNPKIISFRNAKNKKIFASTLFKSGKFFFEQKQYEIALVKFEMAKKFGYKTPELYSFLAECYNYCGEDSGKALYYAKKGLINNHNNISIRSYAISLYFCGQLKKALKYFHLLKNIEDDDTSIWIAANINFSLNNYFEAYKYINKIKDVTHFNTKSKIKVFLIKGKILYNLDMKKSSLKNFLNAYHLGDNNDSLYYISKIYFDYEDFKNAVKYLHYFYSSL